jgi:hypothetical protein
MKFTNHDNLNININHNLTYREVFQKWEERISLKRYEDIRNIELLKEENKRKYKHMFTFLKPFDEENARIIKNCSRLEARAVTGILSGTALTNKHLYNMGKQSHIACRFCKKKTETTYHWIAECVELEANRQLLNTNVKDTSIQNWIKFIKSTKIIETFKYQKNKTDTESSDSSEHE